MCCSYNTQNIAMALHYVKVQHNVQELAYQYFVFISLSATVFTILHTFLPASRAQCTTVAYHYFAYILP